MHMHISKGHSAFSETTRNIQGSMNVSSIKGSEVTPTFSSATRVFETNHIDALSTEATFIPKDTGSFGLLSVTAFDHFSTEPLQSSTDVFPSQISSITPLSPGIDNTQSVITAIGAGGGALISLLILCIASVFCVLCIVCSRKFSTKQRKFKVVGHWIAESEDNVILKIPNQGCDQLENNHNRQSTSLALELYGKDAMVYNIAMKDDTTTCTVSESSDLKSSIDMDKPNKDNDELSKAIIERTTTLSLTNNHEANTFGKTLLPDESCDNPAMLPSENSLVN